MSLCDRMMVPAPRVQAPALSLAVVQVAGRTSWGRGRMDLV